MNKILRTLGLSAAVVGTLGLGTTPANATAAGTFVGEAHINCFGCGVSTGTANLCVTGVIEPLPTAEVCVYDGKTWNMTASYTVTEIPSQCPVTGSATGSTSGVVNVTFSWTRVGATALISTVGDVDGGGVGTFAVVDPVGNPCGGEVTASVAGVVAGS